MQNTLLTTEWISHKGTGHTEERKANNPLRLNSLWALRLCEKILFFLFLFSLPLLLAAQSADDPNEGTVLSYDYATETFNLSFWGREGYYFILHSTDLMDWNWVPVWKLGEDEALQWHFTSTDPGPFFYRLIRSNDPDSWVMRSDFNGTGISTWDELQLGTNPFEWVDTMGQGLPDAWSLYYFGLLAVDPAADADGDGLTNLQEYLSGSNPLQPDHPAVGLLVFRK